MTTKIPHLTKLETFQRILEAVKARKTIIAGEWVNAFGQTDAVGAALTEELGDLREVDPQTIPAYISRRFNLEAYSTVLKLNDRITDLDERRPFLISFLEARILRMTSLPA